MLLELAIGDAYGSAFEYSSKDFIEEKNHLRFYQKHPRHDIPPGYYTDDTQMSLAIAELVLSGSAWTPLTIANKFVEVFKRDPRKGYASGFYNFLQGVKDGTDFLQRIKADSDKSGAAMRTTPIGLYSDLREVRSKSRLQASVTHNTIDGMVAAEAAALLVYFCKNSIGPVSDSGIWIQEILDGTSANDWSVPWFGKVKTKGWMSVRAAITAVSQNNSLSELLKACIAFSGDVDTVAAIALAAASTSEQYTQDLPDVLIWGLENNLFGRDYLIGLDKQLKEI